MYYNGDILFAISDEANIVVDFGDEIFPTKIVSKGEIVALGRKAPMNRWIYEKYFADESEYLVVINEFIEQLYEKREYIKQLKERYDDVSITINIRSDYGQLGYSLPNSILEKVSAVGCDMHFDILSFGYVKE